LKERQILNKNIRGSKKIKDGDVVKETRKRERHGKENKLKQRRKT
jgi:hypothetical protein